MKLSIRARLTFFAHLYKCLVRQDHDELRPVLGRLIPEDGVILDVGGHGGQFCKLLASMVPRGYVHTFEPGSYAHSILVLVARIKRMRNVSIHKLALGDCADTLLLNVPIKKSGSIGYGLSHLGLASQDRAYVTETVEQTTIDTFVQELELAKIDFIKADIEGWEYNLVLGAGETISRYRPILLLEVNEAHLVRAGASVEALAKFFLDRDYVAMQRQPVNDELVVTPVSEPGDFFFMPSERMDRASAA